MNLTEEITAVKAKLADLKKQITPQLSEQKEHYIRQRIIAKEYQLTELFKLQNIPTGEKHSTHRIHRIPISLSMLSCY